MPTSAVVLSCLATAVLLIPTPVRHDEAAVIERTAIARPPERAKRASVIDSAVMDRPVIDRAGNVLELGNKGWARRPMPPHLRQTPPMCNDEVWMEWAAAYLNEKEYAAGAFGVCYMLAGNGGANNIDPYSAGPTDDNQWITEGPPVPFGCPALRGS